MRNIIAYKQILSLDLSTWEAVTQTRERVRGNAIGTLCSSHIRGNSSVWFQEGKGLVTAPTYSTSLGRRLNDEPANKTWARPGKAV